MAGVTRRTLSISWLCIALSALPGAAWADVLATVNGSDITDEILDQILMRSHNSDAMRTFAEAGALEVLNKAIDDELIWQDALAMGIDQDPDLLAEMDKLRLQSAISRYLKGAFAPPTSVPDEAIREHFERYYFKVHIRQLSVAEAELAESLREQIISDPAAMPSLVREHSIDARKAAEGLHREKYWRDVEEIIRQHASNLDPGQLSAIFPYNDAFAFVRLESRGTLDEAVFEATRETIRQELLAAAADEAWLEFSEKLLRETPVTLTDGIFENTQADADKIFHADFRTNSEAIALRVSDELYLTEGQLRKSLSKRAMEDGTAPFETVFEATVLAESERLALAHRAAEAGIFEDPDLTSAYERKLRESVIGYYLEQTVVPRITFRRDEFQAFYDENIDRFRGPDEVKLDILMIDDEAKARELEARLEDGADWQYMKKKYGGNHAASSGESKWAAVELFSDAIRAELAGMKVGGTSHAVEMATGWMFFRLDNERQGTAMSIEKADPVIRQVMYKQKFQQLVKEQLSLLRERSEIVYHEDAIAAYASAGE